MLEAALRTSAISPHLLRDSQPSKREDDEVREGWQSG